MTGPSVAYITSLTCQFVSLGGEGQIHKCSTKMRRLSKHAELLKALAGSKPNLRRVILEGAGSSLIKCLCECAINVLKGNVPLNKRQFRKLRCHKHGLGALTKRRSNASKRRILQSGGFLGTLPRPILGVLDSILGG